jgi:hypothetical protein
MKLYCRRAVSNRYVRSRRDRVFTLKLNLPLCLLHEYAS